jgi:hypothetical protein
MASSLYRLLAVRIGNGYESAKSRHLFRDFIDASAGVTIGEGEVVVKFQKRVHNESVRWSASGRRRENRRSFP